MDYPFFVKPLLTLPKDLFQEMRELVLKLEDKWIMHPFFRSTVLQSMKSRDHKSLDECVYKVVALLDPYFPKTAWSTYSLNRLMPNDIIGEHSDVNTKGGIQPLTYMLMHKLHIPLVTNSKVTSLHRRTNRLPFDTNVMQEGTVYLYNDYVWHAGANGGDEPRVHMIVKYDDPDWQLRLKMLTKIGFNPYNTYETDA